YHAERTNRGGGEGVVAKNRENSLRRQLRGSISGSASLVQALVCARAARCSSYSGTLSKPENHTKTVSPSLTGSRGKVFGPRSVTRETRTFAEAAASRGLRTRVNSSAKSSSVRGAR